LKEYRDLQTFTAKTRHLVGQSGITNALNGFEWFRNKCLVEKPRHWGVFYCTF